MASSSSSPPSSILPRKWKHQVFPSFHGADVRKSFLSCIWKEFRRKGIITITDSEIGMSNSIAPNLIKAIRESRIAIVMISRNYASSSWCLNELVEIMKCRELLGQVVVPVFYEVDPIDVKKQTGEFGELFRITCEGKTKEDTERWRQALTEVAMIVGYILRYWPDEASLIEKIATDISNILMNSTPSIDFDGLVGMEAHMESMLCLDYLDDVDSLEYLAKGFSEVRQELIITNQDVKDDLYTSERACKRISNGLLHAVYIYCEDTLQYSFASHLSMDFRRKGIYASVNCNETLDVIEGARASVVVFSKNFLSSTSCLDKLVRILQGRRKNGQLVVVPVFYGVSPSDVVVTEHKSADRIREWSSALQELRELPGHQSRERFSECELVEEIVKDVYKKLFPAEHIGIESKLLEIEHLLRKQTWGVRRIGIWGMPGIGKTTLARAFFDQISGGYEASCFIQHFDKAFHEKGLHRLLEEHFGNILKDLPRVCSSITRPSLPRDKLSKKRTLVVLDDVHNPLVAESFLGGFHWFGPGSLIIITSRDKQVFTFCQINHVYMVQSLNENEALQLFSQCAFGQDIREQNLLELSMEVIDYANGNPLALSFYGRELKGRRLSEMRTTFFKLKLRTPYKIYDLFKSSYETLNDNEKNIFLDVACFFKGENVDYVIRLLEGCGFFPHVGIDVLVDKCLVTISENRVKMHKIIQDFGREIINSETVQIERRRKLWEPWTIKFLLEYDKLDENEDPMATYTRALGTEDIEGIFLETSNLLFDVKPTAFENMLNLRFLKIYCSSDENHYGLHLPKGLDSLPYELRLLHWENYPLQTLPQDFDPCHLVELNMSNSQLLKLWEGTKNHEMLKMIRLCHSQQLTEIDDICRAQNVELIDLQGCTKLQSFPATGQLEHLRVVNLSGCKEIKSFAEVSSNIRELHLQGTSIRELPISIGNATKLKELYLTGCSSLVELPASIEKATNLQILNLEYCSSLVELPSSVGNAINLKELYLNDCSSLVELPASMGNDNLEILDLSNCSSLTKLSSSFGNVINLKELYLSEWLNLVELPASIGNATNLEILDLSYCSSLVELPSSFGNATNLKELCLNRCSSLVELPASMVNVSLELLDLSYCSSLVTLSSFANAINLKELYLIGWPSLVELPASTGNATNLEILDLSYCSSLVKLPSSFGNATNLKKLYLTGCSSLVELPSFENVINLKELYINGCSSLVELPASIGNVINLERLVLSNCTSLVKLPSSFGNTTNLKELYFSGCSSLVELPASMGNAITIEILDLSSCTSLVKLPSSFGIASNLKELYFNGCLNLVELSTSIGSATNLEILDLSNCTSLMEFPSSFGNALNLKKLYLTGCSSLVELPSFENVINLKELYLNGCSSLVEIPASIRHATNLEILDLSYCSSLVELPASIRNASNLEILDLSYSSSLVKLSSFANTINLKELYCWRWDAYPHTNPTRIKDQPI